MSARTITGLAFILCLGISACGGGPTTPEPVAPKPRTFVTVPPSISSQDGPWVIDSPGPLTQNELDYVAIDGIQAIALRGNALPFVIAQDINANLFLTPYFRWLWHMQDPGDTEHPVRLVLGFKLAGAITKAAENPKPSHNLAPHNRTLLIGWGTSALQRGTLFPANETRLVPKYIMRGGTEQAEQWQQDTVDLAALYRRAWPADNLENVRLSFIGFAVEGGKGHVQGRFSGISLMR